MVLLFELIFSIFLRSIDTYASTDAFFRISFSSVMGYFLGGMNTNGSATKKITETTSLDEQVNKAPHDHNFQHLTNIRTLFITIVCLACIITLSIATFYSQSDYTEGLIQLRNIISTTIGFLISKAKYRN